MVKKPSVVDQIVENLRDFLKSDVLTIGQKLPSETELAHRYGVGRSTIREALRLLQAQGFVELRPNAGAFLSSKEPDSTKAIHWIAEHGEDVLDVMEIRYSIEGIAARMAAERAKDEDIYCLFGIQTLMEQACAADDSMNLALYDEAFHEAIARATHNQLMCNLVAQLSTACANFRGKTFLAHKGNAACAAHVAILQAIRAHDGVAAQQKMETHMRENYELARAYNEQKD